MATTRRGTPGTHPDSGEPSSAHVKLRRSEPRRLTDSSCQRQHAVGSPLRLTLVPAKLARMCSSLSGPNNAGYLTLARPFFLGALHISVQFCVPSSSRTDSKGEGLTAGRVPSWFCDDSQGDCGRMTAVLLGRGWGPRMLRAWLARNLLKWARPTPTADY